MSAEKNIIIVGGGFAGTTLMRALDGKLPSGYRLLLIGEEEPHDVQPDAAGGGRRLHLSGAGRRPDPADDRRTRRFVMGRVTQVDPARRALTASTLAGDITLSVRASRAGARKPGAARPHPGTRAARAAVEDRRRCDAHSQHGAAAGRPDRAGKRSRVRRQLGHFVIIGGGFSGVETCGPSAIARSSSTDTTRNPHRRPRSSQYARRSASPGNLPAAIAGQPTRAFSHRSRGAMAAIGHSKGVADLCGIRLSGLAAWLLAGAPTTSRRCPRSAARCASSSSGHGERSSPTTSRTCAFPAATTPAQTWFAREFTAGVEVRRGSRSLTCDTLCAVESGRGDDQG